jgi:hypothetical protein
MRLITILIVCFGVTAWNNAAAGVRQDVDITFGTTPFDRYRSISPEEERKRLSVFAEALEKMPKAWGYIIVYSGSGRPTTLKTARLRARRILNYLVTNCGSDPKRLIAVAIDSRIVNEPTVELWAVPGVVAMMKEIPGVDPSDLRSKRVLTVKGNGINQRKRPR